VNVPGRPSPRAEPHNLYTLTAEIESPTKRAESTILISYQNSEKCCTAIADEVE
jgi:hypothetical protein